MSPLCPLTSSYFRYEKYEWVVVTHGPESPSLESAEDLKSLVATSGGSAVDGSNPA